MCLVLVALQPLRVRSYRKGKIFPKSYLRKEKVDRVCRFQTEPIEYLLGFMIAVCAYPSAKQCCRLSFHNTNVLKNAQTVKRLTSLPDPEADRSPGEDGVLGIWIHKACLNCRQTGSPIAMSSSL